MLSRIPNFLSISRIGLAVVLILLTDHLSVRGYIATVIMLTIAVITDGLDGYLARRWGTVSDCGYVLDTMGDRAVHLALMLVFLVRYAFHPVFIWLLVFRDIGIYAIRVLSKDWLSKSRQMRPIFLLHTTCLRAWLGLFLLRDAFRVFTGSDVLNTTSFQIAQYSIISVTLLISYYGLFQSFGWLVDHDHSSL